MSFLLSAGWAILPSVKVAFHFNVSHPAFGSDYGPKVEALLFTKLLERRTLHLSSKVYKIRMEGSFE
jgi:hypothetical protein